jgi:hypothetical protein
MRAAYVAKDNRLPSRSVAVFDQPSSIRPELTGILLALEDCQCPGSPWKTVLGRRISIFSQTVSDSQLRFDEAAKERAEARFSSAALQSNSATAPPPHHTTD